MRLIKILLISFCIIITLSQNVFALEQIINVGEDWVSTGKEVAANDKLTLSTKLLKEKSSAIYNLFLAAATIIAVIVGAILGIKFMTAGIDQKVEVKQALFPYLISCTVVFGSFGIWKLVVVIMSEI